MMYLSRRWRTDLNARKRVGPNRRGRYYETFNTYAKGCALSQ